MDFATNRYDEGKQLNASYLDLSKNFDKVLHKRLVLQLKGHGVRDDVLSCVEQRLSWEDTGQY